MPDESGTKERSPSLPPTETDLCRAFVSALPVDGASISVFTRGGMPSTVCVSDVTAAHVDELHFELGEGPYWDVLKSGEAVLLPSLREDGSARWPVWSAAMRRTAIGALFAFPLSLGATTVGAVGLYCAAPTRLSATDVAAAMNLAALTVIPAINRAVEQAEGEAAPGAITAPEMRRDVLQATGMILSQLEISATEAFSRLRAHAFATGRSVREVAADVTARRLDFRDLQ